MSSTSTDYAGDQTSDQDSLRKKIKDNLSRYDVGSRYNHIPLQKASVLLPLQIRQGRLYLLLTVRSMKLKTMPGDVCFPGGRQDPSDQDEIETALRESKEEIGLCAHQVEIVCRLLPYVTKSPVFLVTPVVGIVEDTFQPTPNPNEVTEVLYVPLDLFISLDHYTAIPYNIPPFGKQTIHKFEHEDPQTKKSFYIWGLTGHFALLISVILLERRPLFDPEFDLESTLKVCEKTILDFNNKSKL
ncbi:PREDICTED: peroxisomal coenzyme A diphosphatase NUDT7 [Nanorana parkeri]|uniref:peroxisomal coenzyme A diphosphatase NUDT7 n=1 Tax=Nanorana parkeri TaxID=125878 RepID=UPI000854E522|nr:PREDICTED: peroxisomal coenzyme A diphosphatase NUDT7 [Nanorana parkeri]